MGLAAPRVREPEEIRSTSGIAPSCGGSCHRKWAKLMQVAAGDFFVICKCELGRGAVTERLSDCTFVYAAIFNALMPPNWHMTEHCSDDPMD